jgi:hypothetical protein
MPIYMTLPVNLHEAKGDAKRRVWWWNTYNME